MINREDMLELTRRMTPKRNCFTRIAGCYLDDEGFIDGTFNTNFLKLKESEKEYHLKIAKKIPFAKTNEALKEYSFPGKGKAALQIQQLFNGINACELKNDELMEVLYEVIAEKIPIDKQYAIFVFHGCYDIPMKTRDNRYLDESEEVYHFLICAICPWNGDYEVGMPEYGWLYPSLKDRSSDSSHIAVYRKNEDEWYQKLIKNVLFL